ncbi:DUF3379 family protein [Spartinivicinus poritis]|uniref:DUF3379 family protein n=1 Tax=Spartinivicinus poritis TaxID=2994640 RepID=A0ABT5U953_9GAMM|nr:DUF3379 family protein [Spartinivicinus sp. A2-2]MDE1461983.1 DUF3379 family protein [Spartinivicinus sp. A2-2]
MNCLEFRRVVLEEPQQLSPALAEHKQQCKECLRYYTQLQEQEALLMEALAVPVPDDLAAKIMLQCSFDQTSDQEVTETEPTIVPLKSKSKTFRQFIGGFAVAASVMMGVVFWQAHLNSEQQQLTEMFVQHMEHEAHSLVLEEPIPVGRVGFTLNNVGIKAMAELANVTYAANCVIEDKMVAHLVVKTDKGPVTVLLMPHKQFGDEFAEEAKQWQVALNNMKQGSVAFIGPKSLNMEPIQQQVMQSVDVLQI